MSESPASQVICPACSSRGTGKFCASCGAILEAAACTGCNAQLTPGARFCHSCGRPAGNASPALPTGPARGTVAATLPWVVAAISLIVLLAFFAGTAFNKRRGSTLDAPQNALPQAGLDDRGTAPVRGPDISQLSPEERADRLYNRVMLLHSQGKRDSVLFFAPMAINAFQMLSPMNADQRYDMGRIAEVAGDLASAKAQADSILDGNPTHLLGLILAARVAVLGNDSTARRTYERRMLSAHSTESAKRLPEYERHSDDIVSAVAEANTRP